jgi:steroid 5-alpha reductase family enzyme
MSILDIGIARVLMALVVFEYFADQQQWNYHQAKNEYQKTAKVPKGWTRAQMDRGFNTTGLWKYSRHPNFAAEQTIWVLLYQWSCFDANVFWNWTVVGAIAYLGVFAGSTPLTEGISAGKYPEYKLYQERVGKFLPAFLGKGWIEEDAQRAAKKE